MHVLHFPQIFQEFEFKCGKLWPRIDKQLVLRINKPKSVPINIFKIKSRIKSNTCFPLGRNPIYLQLVETIWSIYKLALVCHGQ